MVHVVLSQGMAPVASPRGHPTRGHVRTHAQVSANTGQSFKTYRVLQSNNDDRTIQRDIPNGLRIVICPIYQTPLTVSGTIPGATCYTAVYLNFQGNSNRGKLYAVQFSLDVNSPQPYNVQYFPYNEAGTVNAMVLNVTSTPEETLNNYIQYGINYGT